MSNSDRVSIEDIQAGRTDKCQRCLGVGKKTVMVGKLGGTIDCPQCGGDGIA